MLRVSVCWRKKRRETAEVKNKNLKTNTLMCSATIMTSYIITRGAKDRTVRIRSQILCHRLCHIFGRFKTLLSIYYLQNLVEHLKQKMFCMGFKEDNNKDVQCLYKVLK